VYEAYLLLIPIDKDVFIHVGNLDEIKFIKGVYVYVGSGGRNVFKRLERHFKRVKKVRWHIDYLTSQFQPHSAYIIPNTSEEEIVEILIRKYPYVRGFGSSDTKYPSHLFHLKNKTEIKKLLNHLRNKGYKPIKYTPKNQNS